MKITKLIPVALLSLAFLLSTGCASNPSSATWKLPKKRSPEYGMIIGRLGQPSNLPYDRDNVVREVFFFNRLSGVYFNGHGERSYVMDNGYFVVVNLRPGKYYTTHFKTDNANYHLPLTRDDTFNIKSHQVFYFGSYDFIPQEQSWSQKFRNKGTYEVKKAAHPTELEILQWLRKAAVGSGWEKDIDKRIHAIARK